MNGSGLTGDARVGGGSWVGVHEANSDDCCRSNRVGRNYGSAAIAASRPVSRRKTAPGQAGLLCADRLSYCAETRQSNRAGEILPLREVPQAGRVASVECRYLHQFYHRANQ